MKNMLLLLLCTFAACATDPAPYTPEPWEEPPLGSAYTATWAHAHTDVDGVERDQECDLTCPVLVRATRFTVQDQGALLFTFYTDDVRYKTMGTRLYPAVEGWSMDLMGAQETGRERLRSTLTLGLDGTLSGTIDYAYDDGTFTHHTLNATP